LAWVPSETTDDPQARLFVALDFSDEVRGQIADWQSKALSDPALRAMRADALHITLCFLASKAEHEIPRIEEVLRSLEPRPVAIRFDREASAVPKGRPRLYTLTAQSDDAVALQAELSEALAAAGLYEPETRNFWPHVTVARVRTERLAPERGKRRGKARPKRVQKQPLPLPKAFEQAFDAVRVVLYRLYLKPQGAEYVALSGIDLPSLRTQKR
jgi:2'-5' RNA ligase